MRINIYAHLIIIEILDEIYARAQELVVSRVYVYRTQTSHAGGNATAAAAAGPPSPWPVHLDFTVGGIKPISEARVTHSFHCAGALHKYLYRGAPYKSPKIAENCAACGGCGSLEVWPRARRTYRPKSLNFRKKRRLRRISEVQPNLRGSLIVLPIVKSSCAGPSVRP